MRLTDGEQAAIKASAQEVFGPAAIVRVFGSRLDDDRRGGDIDLHVQVDGPGETIGRSGSLRSLLNKRVGERDYDIVVSVIGLPLSPVDRKAIVEGVVL